MSHRRTYHPKAGHSDLYQRYLSTIRAYVIGPKRDNDQRPIRIGQLGIASGLAATDFANLHRRAMLALLAERTFSTSGVTSVRRAGDFFALALVPVEAALRATKETNRHLQLRNDMLRSHATALANGNLRLQREITRRKAGELTIRKAKEHYQTLFLESKVMQKKLRHLTHQILSAQEDERKEISRALHDEVTQTLVGINVELSALGKREANGVRWKQAVIARTQRLVANSVNEVHRFARELRPAVLDDLGLIPALHTYARALAERKKLAIRFTAFAGVEALGEKERTMLYRVAQEALTNVARHAEASDVSVNLLKVRGMVRLEIIDNGKSFPVQRVLNSKNPRRLGLVGMKERVEMFGGTLIIRSNPDHGTTVCADIPFKKRKLSP